MKIYQRKTLNIKPKSIEDYNKKNNDVFRKLYIINLTITMPK